MSDDIFNPKLFFAGHDFETAEEVVFDLERVVERTMELIAGSGFGKSALITELLRALALTGKPYVYFDFAQTGSDYMQCFDAFVAEFIRTGVEEPFATRLPELRGITDAFIARHAYANVGEVHPAVRINPLRRCRFQDGSVETPEEVAQRMDNVWDCYLGKESKMRVQFKRYLTCTSALLAAADRAPHEFVELLDDASFRRELIAEQQRLGTHDDDFVQRQWQVLDGVLSLTTANGNPTKEQRDELHSLRNALEPLASGSLKAFFSDETFALEDVAYGDKRLHLAVAALNSDSTKKFVMCAVWSMLDTLIEKRRWVDDDPIGLEVIDEPNWLPEMFFQRITLRRNKRWASIVLRQTDDAQFVQMGLPQAAAILRASSAVRIHGRKDSVAAAEELAYRIKKFSSDVFIQKLVESVSASEATGESTGTSQGTSDGVTRGTGVHSGTSKTTDHEGRVSTTVSKGSSVHEGSAASVTRSTQAGSSHTTTVGKTLTYQWHRITPQEQHMLLTQSLLRLPEHVGVAEMGDDVRIVLFAPPRVFPFDATVKAYVERNRALLRPRLLPAEPLRFPAYPIPEPAIAQVADRPMAPVGQQQKAGTKPWMPPKKR